MVSHLGPRPSEPPNKTDKWLTPQELGKVLNCHPRTVVNRAKFNWYLFPKAVMVGRFYFWKWNDVLRWQYKRIAAYKHPIHGIRTGHEI